MAKKKVGVLVRYRVSSLVRIGVAADYTRLCDNTLDRIGDHAGRAEEVAKKQRLRSRWKGGCGRGCCFVGRRSRDGGLKGWDGGLVLASELAGALTRTNSHAARQESPGLIHRASPPPPPRTPAALSFSHPRSLFLSPPANPAPATPFVHRSRFRSASSRGTHRLTLVLSFFFFLLSLVLFSLLSLRLSLPPLRLTLVCFF